MSKTVYKRPRRYTRKDRVIARQAVEKWQEHESNINRLKKFREEAKIELIKRLENGKIKDPNSALLFSIALDNFVVKRIIISSKVLGITDARNLEKFRLMPIEKRNELRESIIHEVSQKNHLSISEARRRVNRRLDEYNKLLQKQAVPIVKE